MKKSIMMLVALVFSAMAVAPHVYAGTCDNLHIKNNLPAFNFTVVKRTPLPNSDVCQIIASVATPQGRQTVPMYATKGFVLIGQLFKRNVDITQLVLAKYANQATEKLIKKYGMNLKKAVVAEYKPKNANGKILYEFADPLCPFCDMIKPHLKKLSNESGYTLKLVWFIVHGKPAYDMAERLVCHHFSYLNYLKYHNTPSDPLAKGKGGCEKAARILRIDQKVSHEFETTGTPTFITSEGQEIVGANLQMLKTVLFGQAKR